LFSNYITPNAAVVGDAHDDVTDYIRDKDFTPNTMLALRTMVSDIGNETAALQANYPRTFPTTRCATSGTICIWCSEAIAPDAEDSSSRRLAMQMIGRPGELQKAHRPLHALHSCTWVKVAVAMAFGLGTMVGWKRIVITVGEKIGKEPSHLCDKAPSLKSPPCATIGAADWIRACR
jgi:phosphate/sulfate permease